MLGMRFLFWWGFFFVAGFALLAFAAPATEASPLNVGVLLGWTFILAYVATFAFRQRWRLRRDGRESGPFTAREIAALQKSGQVGGNAEIKPRRGGAWSPFIVTEQPPNRLDPAFLFGVIGLAVGFAVSYGLFGRVDGHWLPMEWIAEVPQQDRFLKTAWAVTSAVPNPFSGMTTMAQAEVDKALAQIERSRYLIIGSTFGLGLLGAIAAASMAPPRFRIVVEKRQNH
jgi:hypothetical protein